MDIFEIYTYDRMPVQPPADESVFETPFKRRAPPVREPFSLGTFWRTWVDDRD